MRKTGIPSSAETHLRKNLLSSRSRHEQKETTCDVRKNETLSRKDLLSRTKQQKETTCDVRKSETLSRKDLLSRTKSQKETTCDERKTETPSSSEGVGGDGDLLLSELVNIVGSILTSKPTHVWQVYGGFQRVYQSINKIFSHGYRHLDIWGNVDLWPFVVGVRVLSPALGPCISNTSTPHPAQDWIRDKLHRLHLSKAITALVSDRDHIEKHYHSWALMQSENYVGGVITCLQALEENSSTTLANVNPKLLLGTCKTPPGTYSLEDNGEFNSVYPQIKPLVLNKTKLRLQTEDSEFDQFSHLTTSLPTSPLAEREWSLLWNQPIQQTYCRKSVCDNEITDHKPSQCHTMEESKQKNMEYKIKPVNVAVLSPSSHIVPSQSGREVTEAVIIDKGHQIQMKRESPDGSSDSSHYPAISPPPPDQSYMSGSTINSESCPAYSESSLKMMQANTNTTNIPHSHTGARPKDFTNIISRSDNQCSTTRGYLDVLDSGGGTGNSISPSLLQVNYGGDCSSEGDKTTIAKATRPRVPQGSRTPQLRHRASSGRLAIGATDSDVDSEDTNTHAQTSRRRRRPHSTQQHSVVSVKALVDSRGVLSHVPDTNDSNDKAVIVTSHITGECDCCHDSSESGGQGMDSTHSPPEKILQDLSSTHSATDDWNTGGQVHVMSTPISAAGPCEVDGIAFSAPARDTLKVNLTTTTPTTTSTSKKKTHGRSRSDGAQELVANKSGLPQSSTVPQLSTSKRVLQSGLQAGRRGLSGEDTRAVMLAQARKGFMEDGGHSITPEADNGFFPRPQPGQSLIGFFSSKEFHKQHAALDRENAHFSVSEAIIGVFTQMQFDTWHEKFLSSQGTGEDSDEEIRNLQARIREKRRQKLSSSILSGSTSSETVLHLHPQTSPWMSNSSSKLESTTDYSVCESPQSSSYESESDPASDLEEEERVLELSLSGEANASGGPTTPSDESFKSDMTSAENVAINLLKHFNEQRLPKASELEWLVSEKDVPQKLLPLPTSVAVGPDDGEGKEVQSQSQLRGTLDWAPPRPQVILTLHKNTKRSAMLGVQLLRCAGCGMRVTPQLSRHFRLCNYFGRYFCTTCHTNQTTIIPAKILHKWDFKMYSVANFSFELIQRMKSDPLFNVSAVNSGLYKKCRHLHLIYIYRLQLYHTIRYIKTCNRAKHEKEILKRIPQHWAQDPHMYSLDDLMAVKDGTLVEEMKHYTTKCINHIADCQVCTGQGFICEVCGRGEAIFPFQLDATAVCTKCHACYHAACFSPKRCPRCIRRETRSFSFDSFDKNNE
ncbi:hypothetical protein Pmani_025454 [Petrolisthes manimaculis]|uniref:RUN domain-containing protein n=1 Tax=Petrolisthes manimaculis TaxID=1843537 RepID=A0AAE1P7W2_9EUCA|nr:hypothetical protein Pmani_025454 [Petrolisthes manimaculis]